ncbi:MAG TPA: ROK family protein [Solirubrobacteraceae bacterium]
MGQRFIGVDVGGTKIATAVLDGSSFSEPALQPTDTSSTEALLQQLATAIGAAAAGDTSAVVGIGAPSVIEFATGRVRYSVNIPLVDVALREELGRRTGLDVVVDNDASVAALAEACDGDGEIAVDSLVLLTIGTGVGGGVIVDGKILRGATGAAPELGHIIVEADFDPGAPEPSATFPQPGSLERAAAGKALDRLAQERGYADGPACLTAAQNGEDAAIEAFTILGERVGIGIASMINTFEPHEVVIGGGVSRAGDLLLAPATETAWKFVLPGVGTETRIRLARYGPSAGVRGAALLAKHEFARVAP